MSAEPISRPSLCEHLGLVLAKLLMHVGLDLGFAKLVFDADLGLGFA